MRLNQQLRGYSLISWGFNGIWWGTMGCSQQNDMGASDTGIYLKLSIDVFFWKMTITQGIFRDPRPYIKTHSNQPASLISDFNEKVSDVVLIYHDILWFIETPTRKELKTVRNASIQLNFVVVECGRETNNISKGERNFFDFHRRSCSSQGHLWDVADTPTKCRWNHVHVIYIYIYMCLHHY